MPLENVIIIGSGPAGYTAAIYAARANLNPLVVEGYQSGGLLMLTSEVENFPGFPKGIQGPELMGYFRAQAERFGTRFIQKDATEVDFSQKTKKVFVGEEVFQAKSIIITTGAATKWLGLESEKRLLGKGVSSCATGTYQDLTVASPYSTTTVLSGYTTQALFVKVNTAVSGTVDIRVYGDTVTF